MTNYRFSQGGAIVFGGSGVLGSGIVDLLSKNNANVAFTYFNNKESADASSLKSFMWNEKKHRITDIKIRTRNGLLTTVVK